MSRPTIYPTLAARQTTACSAACHAKIYIAAGILTVAAGLVGCQADSMPSANAATANDDNSSHDNKTLSLNNAPGNRHANSSVTEQAKLINQEANLYQVTPHLFRSEQLREADVPLLKTNHIDAILSLRFFGQDEDQELLAPVIEDANIALYNQPLKSWHVTPKEVAEALYKINTLEAQNKRVLVHCYHGADRTGIIIAMYRIVEQGWSIDDAKREMTQGGFGYHPIWINLPHMLNPVTVAQVRQELAKLQSEAHPIKAA
ncbi:MAG: dual specificity protein phosphatase family protein [Psychrobacter sp.]|nr:dual specificity protein phosphatase family protein [Psychrobacter sp.]